VVGSEGGRERRAPSTGQKGPAQRPSERTGARAWAERGDPCTVLSPRRSPRSGGPTWGLTSKTVVLHRSSRVKRCLAGPTGHSVLLEGRQAGRQAPCSHGWQTAHQRVSHHAGWSSAGVESPLPSASNDRHVCYPPRQPRWALSGVLSWLLISALVVEQEARPCVCIRAQRRRLTAQPARPSPRLAADRLPPSRERAAPVT
jgi:hypothetical protein